MKSDKLIKPLVHYLFTYLDVYQRDFDLRKLL